MAIIPPVVRDMEINRINVPRAVVASFEDRVGVYLASEEGVSLGYEMGDPRSVDKFIQSLLRHKRMTWPESQ